MPPTLVTSGWMESTARRYETDLRTGALILAVNRVEEATRIRGIFP